MDIKEESCSGNEGASKDLIKKVKIETSDSDTKPELEEDSTCYSQNEYHIIRFNETVKEIKIETEIDIKEEWLESASCINKDIQDEKHEDFYSTKSPSVYKQGVSSSTSDLFSSENFENGISFNMKDSPERESGRKYQRKLIQKSKSNKQNINKNSKSLLTHQYKNSNKHDISQTHSTDPFHLEKYTLILNSEDANNSYLRDNGLNHSSSVKSHKLTDDGKKTHKCEICNKVFKTLSSLKKHKLIHEGVKLHKCITCNKAFTTLSNFKAHKLNHQGIKPHKCDICNKAFTKLSNLKEHKLIHEGIKPHKCNVCNRAFLLLKHLKTHKLVHEDTKQHKCNICNKAFRHLSYLKTHTLIHENIKPHKCNICNKAFTKLSNLKVHKLFHEGIKPHKCNVCNRAFTLLAHLKDHKLIHEGIKPYKCNICNKAFIQLSNFRTHKLTHEGLQPHK